MINPPYTYTYNFTPLSKTKYDVYTRLYRKDINSEFERRRAPFQAFFKGIVQHSANQSLVKYLPNDIVEIIWEEYILQTFSIKEIIKYRFNHVYLKYQMYHANHWSYLYQNPVLLKTIIRNNNASCIPSLAFENYDIIFRHLIRYDNCSFSDFLFFYDLSKNLTQEEINELCCRIFSEACDYKRYQIINFILAKLYSDEKVLLSASHLAVTYFNSSCNLDVLKRVYTYFKYTIDEYFASLDIASENELCDLQMTQACHHVDACVWLYEKNFYKTTTPGLTEQLFTAAGEHANFELLVWLSDKFQDDDKIEFLQMKALAESLRFHHEQFAKWIVDNYIVVKRNFSSNVAILDIVCRTENMHLLEWLHSKNIFRSSSSAMLNAAIVNNFDTMKWLHNNRSEYKEPICSVKTMEMAVENNNFDMVRWLYENRSEIRNPKRETFLPSYLYLMAAESGNLEMLAWLYSKYKKDYNHKLEHNPFTICKGAAKYGHVHILSWLYENDFDEFHHDAIYEAAKNGHVNVLDWIKKTLNDDFNHYSRELITRMMLVACEHGHLNVMNWLQEHAPERIRSTHDYIDRAAKYDQLHVVKWLLENRKQDGFTKCAYSSSCDLRIINLLSKHNCCK